jgi:hypothetical protein
VRFGKRQELLAAGLNETVGGLHSVQCNCSADAGRGL